MIVGLGTDICPPSRWRHLVERFGAEKMARRILAPEEAEYLLGGNRERLPERLAGRWALREAFGKALGTGLDGWSWKELRFKDGRLRAELTLVVSDVATARALEVARSAGIRAVRSPG